MNLVQVANKFLIVLSFNKEADGEADYAVKQLVDAAKISKVVQDVVRPPSVSLRRLVLAQVVGRVLSVFQRLLIFFSVVYSPGLVRVVSDVFEDGNFLYEFVEQLPWGVIKHDQRVRVVKVLFLLKLCVNDHYVLHKPLVNHDFLLVFLFEIYESLHSFHVEVGTDCWFALKASYELVLVATFERDFYI